MAIIKNPLTLVKQEGGGQTQGEYFARVIDYDGTVLKEEWLNNGDNFELPTPPTHTGLVFDGWQSNELLTETTNNGITTYNVIVSNDIMAGALYYTQSDLDEFDIELTPYTGLTVEFYVSGSKSVDWGDGSTETSTSNGYKSHTYINYGEYTIKSNDFSTGVAPFNVLDVATNTNANNYVLKHIRYSKNRTHVQTLINNINLEDFTISSSILDLTFTGFRYNSKLKCSMLPASGQATVSYNAFNIVVPYGTIQASGQNNFFSVDFVALPKTVTSIGTNFFQNARIRQIKIPNNVTTISNQAFYNSRLKKITLSNSITSISNAAFSGCPELREVNFYANVSSIPTQCFQSCYINKIDFGDNTTITSIGSNAFTAFIGDFVCPQNVTSIGSQAFRYSPLLSFVSSKKLTSIASAAFQSTRQILYFDFSKCEQIPTLASSDVFNSTNDLAKILVPSALYNDWIVATNWSNYASRIVAV